MGKFVRRIRFLSEWHIGETESWLTDMASQGLHLESFGKIFAHFERGEPEDVRYRVDYTNTEYVFTIAQREFYAASGWEYVCELGNVRIFRSPEALNAPEIHSDTAEQSFSLRKLWKYPIFTLLLWGYIAVSFFRRFSILEFVEGIIATSSIEFGLSIWAIVLLVRELLFARRLVQDLREGRAINHHADWKTRTRSQRIICIVLVALYVLYMAGILIPDARTMLRGVGALPDTGNNPLHLRLSDIETDPTLESKEFFRIRGFAHGSYVSHGWSLLASEIVTISETGIIPGEKWSADRGYSTTSLQYEPGISVKLYRLRFPWLTDSVLEAFCEQYHAEYMEELLIEKTDYPGFDKLFVRSRERYSQQEVFASCGNDVVSVRYYGNKDMETVIEAVRNWMENL